MKTSTRQRLLGLGVFLIVATSAVIVTPFQPISGWVNIPVRLGLDLQGGAHLTYEADMKDIGADDRVDALESARDVIEKRVNVFGVSEPVVQSNVSGDTYRIIVDLPGVGDISAAINQIGQTPTLVFYQLGQQRTDEEAEARAKEVLQKIQAGGDFVSLANEYTDDPGNGTGEVKQGGDLGWAQTDAYVQEFGDALAALKDGQVSQSPVRTDFGYHIIQRLETRTVEKEVDGEKKQVEEVRARHILIRVPSADGSLQSLLTDYAPTQLTGKQLERARVVYDPTTGKPQVSLQFNSEGADLFAEITRNNVGKAVGIFLDGSPISAPVVNEEIVSGEAVINGNFTIDEAKELAKSLNAGALPVPISLVSQQSIGASLGNEAVNKSIVAGIIGLIAVAVFMLLYYRLPGLIAVIALMCYAIIVFAVFKLWPVTLTLSGIAGFLLSIGMAVDANILIFERMKEEIRAGSDLKAALKHGFERAWLSIRDSNASSLITCAILWYFGTGLVRGFALTLGIGIAVSMFTAITVSRLLMGLTVRKDKSTWWFGVSPKKKVQSI